ncbi:hypothetical protein FJY94_04740 [Candidatus Kaiserbacteria bacterium]|nr:hypothetical protein [Candidatus Kaiserbacteria bacterium]
MLDIYNALFGRPLFEGMFMAGSLPLTVKLSALGALVVVVTAVGYVALLYQMQRSTQPPPISSWLLWLALDAMLLLAAAGKGLLSIQMLTYTVGTALMCLVIYSRGVVTWTKNDSYTALCVALSLATWFLVADKTVAQVIALAGITVATWPLVSAIVARDADESWFAWSFFVAGSAAAYLDGEQLSGAWCGALQVVLIGLIIVFPNDNTAQART